MFLAIFWQENLVSFDISLAKLAFQELILIIPKIERVLDQYDKSGNRCVGKGVEKRVSETLQSQT